MCIEVLCGCGRLSDAIEDVGFKSIRIDHKYNKDPPDRHWFRIDLSPSVGQQVFWKLINDTVVEYVHFAPPCGTASRARERHLKGGVDPKPLRSDQFPGGILNLTGLALRKVQEANVLYEFSAEAAVEFSKRRIPWSLENPQNSIMC